MTEETTRATGYVRWRNGTSEPIEVDGDGQVFIDGFGPFTFTELLTEFRAKWVQIERW